MVSTVESELDPPIATATIARLYMEQGKLDQAERLYRRLLDEKPDDKELSEGLATVLRQREEARSASSADHVRLRVEGGASSCLCSWRVTPEGLYRARMVLETTGRLALRVAAFPSGTPEESEKTILLEPGQLEGELEVHRPGEAKMIAAAVGLMGDTGRFVAIAHCRAASLDVSQEGP